MCLQPPTNPLEWHGLVQLSQIAMGIFTIALVMISYVFNQFLVIFLEQLTLFSSYHLSGLGEFSVKRFQLPQLPSSSGKQFISVGKRHPKVATSTVFGRMMYPGVFVSRQQLRKEMRRFNRSILDVVVVTDSMETKYTFHSTLARNEITGRHLKDHIGIQCNVCADYIRLVYDHELINDDDYCGSMRRKKIFAVFKNHDAFWSIYEQSVASPSSLMINARTSMISIVVPGANVVTGSDVTDSGGSGGGGDGGDDDDDDDDVIYSVDSQ